MYFRKIMNVFLLIFLDIIIRIHINVLNKKIMNVILYFAN